MSRKAIYCGVENHLSGKGQGDCRQRPQKDEIGGGLSQALKDECAKPPCPDQCPDRGKPHVLHQNDPRAIISDQGRRVQTYLENIDGLWRLGTKDFSLSMTEEYRRPDRWPAEA